MVDFEWYRSFIAIYRHLSVSEAAKTRMMTQPAMSQHLAALEAEVGAPLFARISRRLIATERGKELYSQVAPLMESLEEVTADLKSASLPHLRVIRIGMSLEFFHEQMIPLLQHEGLSTVSYFGTADQLVEMLSSDQVDLIVTSKKYAVPGIEYDKLMEEQFAIIAPPQLVIPPLASLKEIEEWLSAQPWIAYGLELPIIRRLWREHFRRRPLIKPLHVIPNLHAIVKAVAAGVGISIVPTYMLNMRPAGVQIVFESLQVRNELFIAYKAKNKHRIELTEMMAALRGER